MANLLYNYNFKVSIGQSVLGFRKISGIARNMEVFTYAEGGLNELVHVFPDRMKSAQSVHLESGILLGSVSPLHHIGVGIDCMRVEVLNAARITQRVYTFKNLVITKWEVSEVNAMQADVLIETFEVVYGEVYVGT